MKQDYRKRWALTDQQIEELKRYGLLMDEGSLAIQLELNRKCQFFTRLMTLISKEA